MTTIPVTVSTQNAVQGTAKNTTASSQKISRKTFTKQRRQLGFAQRRRMANQAARQLNRRFLSRKCQHIGMYVDDFGELPILPLFLWAKKRGKTVYLPVVFGKKLLFRKVAGSRICKARFAKHRLGMQQPQHGRAVSVRRLDVLFLPLVAADKEGNRMGMGGGFYDRTLAPVAKFATHKKAIKKPVRVGWAYDFQVVEKLPSRQWDIPLHQLVTTSVHYFF